MWHYAHKLSQTGRLASQFTIPSKLRNQYVANGHPCRRRLLSATLWICVGVGTFLNRSQGVYHCLNFIKKQSYRESKCQSNAHMWGNSSSLILTYYFRHFRNLMLIQSKGSSLFWTNITIKKNHNVLFNLVMLKDRSKYNAENFLSIF